MPADNGGALRLLRAADGRQDRNRRQMARIRAYYRAAGVLGDVGDCAYIIELTAILLFYRISKI